MTDATPQPVAPQPAAPLTPAEDKQWASFAHFGGVLGFLPALIIFLVFRERGTLTKQESKEALNWQITWIASNIVLQIILAIINVVIWNFAYGAAYFVLSGLFGFIGWLPYLANLVLSIMGGIKVNGGGTYRYPFAIRLIK